MYNCCHVYTKNLCWWWVNTQVMGWCHEATSHYLIQYWTICLMPYSVTRTQWLNECCYKYVFSFVANKHFHWNPANLITSKPLLPSVGMNIDLNAQGGSRALFQYQKHFPGIRCQFIKMRWLCDCFVSITEIPSPLYFLPLVTNIILPAFGTNHYTSCIRYQPFYFRHPEPTIIFPALGT